MDSGKGKSHGIVFGSRFSRWIAGMYFAIIAFLVFMLIYMPLNVEMEPFERVAFVILFTIVLLIIIFTVVRAYKMKFTVTPPHIIVSGIFRQNRINISEIESIHKTAIPFGFRLFGASFLGGWYYLPGVGKAWVTMSNFRDGVLISTKKGGNYVITPQDPYEFIRVVEEQRG
ncbi:MAG: PH domain-containing protein [Archaeoglobaceae archaeon]